MRNVFHWCYQFVGHVICKIMLLYWNIRDRVNPPKEDAVLFVAHPDDDTLFFHTWIQKEKPYVCLMTTGWSLRRMPCFIKAMKQYGVRFRAYDMETNDQREELIVRRVKKVLSLGHFKTVASHNREGEYGHEMHRRMHRCVAAAVGGPVLCPVTKEEIGRYPLPACAVSEKTEIFQQVYITEVFVLDEYADWVCHEKLRKAD